MKIKIRHNQMEEIEGLHNEYPYAYHHVQLPSTIVPWHWHEALEFNYVLSGCVKVTTPGQNLQFSANEAFFINSNVLATMVPVNTCVLDSHLFDAVFLGGHFKSVFETKYLYPVTQNRQIEIVAIRGETPVQKQLLQKLRQLAILQQQTDAEFQTRNLLSDIWILLLDTLKQSQTTVVQSRDRDRILTMLSYIHENYHEKLSLAQIAASAAISPRECLRCFQSCIQQSPTEYLITYRVDAAKKLLKTTALPITEIAMQTGFNSAAYFAKIFRRTTGKTPNGYRKEAADLQKEAINP